MNPKNIIIAILAASVACGAAFGLGYWLGHGSGYQACQTDQIKAEKKQAKIDAESVKEVRQVAESREKVIYKIKEVIRNVPAKDCIDMPLPDLDDGLRDAYYIATRSKTD